jgi:hypothetical protein
MVVKVKLQLMSASKVFNYFQEANKSFSYSEKACAFWFNSMSMNDPHFQIKQTL